MKVSIIQATPSPIETISEIASICYDSNPKNPMKLVTYLYKCGHLSVFEHICFTFKIEDISRACSHQLVRHRHCSFTQRSQRYCSENGFGFVTPPSIENNEELEHYENYMKTFVAPNYTELQTRDVPNEDARYILPNACMTSLYLSCNLRELIHMANERLCMRAQWEIRELVKKMVSLVDPAFHFMLVPKCESGRIICHTPCANREVRK